MSRPLGGALHMLTEPCFAAAGFKELENLLDYCATFSFEPSSNWLVGAQIN